MKIRFILEGGYSAIAQATKQALEINGFTMARFESGQYAPIHKEEEGIKWEEVK